MYVIEVRNATMKGIVTIMRVIMNDHWLQMLQLKLERLRNRLVMTAMVTTNRYRDSALEPKV
jgi:hypothetical protein